MHFGCGAGRCVLTVTHVSTSHAVSWRPGDPFYTARGQEWDVLLGGGAGQGRTASNDSAVPAGSIPAVGSSTCASPLRWCRQGVPRLCFIDTFRREWRRSTYPGSASGRESLARTVWLAGGNVHEFNREIGTQANGRAGERFSWSANGRQRKKESSSSP